MLHDTGVVCAVDMGSNTFKFIVAEMKNGQYLQYFDERKTAAVGDDLRASQEKLGRKLISDAKIKEIQSLLISFQDRCDQQTHSRRMHAIATAAFREAENISEILELLHQQDVEVRILTPEEESAYAYDAATLGEEGFAVLDLGSRTTEFVTRNNGKYEWILLNTGYKLAWDDFFQNADTFQQASESYVTKLSSLITDSNKKLLLTRRELVVIEVGETAAYILGIPQDQVEGKEITHAQVQRKLKELSESFADLKVSFKDAPKVLPRLVFIDFMLRQTGYEKFRATNRELNVAILLRLAAKH